MNKSEKNTIMNHAMRTATTPNEAWNMGDSYFVAAEEEAYKSLDRNSIHRLLCSAHTIQKENGLLCLYNDPTMP